MGTGAGLAPAQVPLLAEVLLAVATGSRSRSRPPWDPRLGGEGRPSLSGMKRGMRPARARPAKRAVARFVTNRLLNPIARRMLERGLWPRTQALLETTGRKTGLARRVPVGNGLRGSTFWIVTEHGYAAHYVENILKTRVCG